MPGRPDHASSSAAAIRATCQALRSAKSAIAALATCALLRLVLWAGAASRSLARSDTQTAMAIVFGMLSH